MLESRSSEAEYRVYTILTQRWVSCVEGKVSMWQLHHFICVCAFTHIHTVCMCVCINSHTHSVYVLMSVMLVDRWMTLWDERLFSELFGYGSAPSWPFLACSADIGEFYCTRVMSKSTIRNRRAKITCYLDSVAQSAKGICCGLLTNPLPGTPTC